MIQSACDITARWCSITITVVAGVDQPVEQPEQVLDIGQMEADVGSSRT